MSTAQDRLRHCFESNDTTLNSVIKHKGNNRVRSEWHLLKLQDHEL